MEPSVSPEREKLALEIKFLVGLSSTYKEEATLVALNKLYPFTQFPLHKVPPVEFLEYAVEEIISQNIKEELQSYCFVVVVGKIRLQKGNFVYDQFQFVDGNIRDKLVFNLDEGNTIAKAAQPSSVLKVHNIWLKRAKESYEESCRKYVHDTLLNIDFFARLSFEQFSKMCKLATVRTLGPHEVLLEEGAVPSCMYIVAEGELVLHKRVEFTKDKSVWQQVNNQLLKDNDLCQQLFGYLVKEPQPNSHKFTVNFQLKVIRTGSIICAKETLNQTVLPYLVWSTLKTKLLVVKYIDLYVLQESRLLQIRSWEDLHIDKEKLRRAYYYQIQWQDYKEFLKKENVLNIIASQSFNDYLRKDINLSQKKYVFWQAPIDCNSISQSPAAKVRKMQTMALS